jgi:hypothetical protein
MFTVKEFSCVPVPLSCVGDTYLMPGSAVTKEAAIAMRMNALMNDTHRLVGITDMTSFDFIDGRDTAEGSI